jgi:class 3 adenylate cyclase
MRLRSKISTALLVLALVPLTLTTALLSVINYDRLIEDARDYRKAVSEHATLSIRELLHGALNELSTIGGIVAQQDLSEQQRMQHARLLLGGTALVRMASVYNPKGQRILTLKDKTYKGPKRPDVLKDSWLKQAWKSGTAYLPVQFSKEGEPRLGIVQAIFSKKGDKVPFCLVATYIPLISLSARLTRLSMRRFGQRPDQVFLLDGKRRMLAHSNRGLWGKHVRDLLPDLGERLKGRSGRFAVTFDYNQGKQQFAATLSPLHQLGWAVVVRQPKEYAYATVRRTIWVALAVGFAFVLLAIFLGLWMGQRLSKPVVEVAEAAGVVAGGDFTARVDIDSNDEVGEMAMAFNAMAGDLQTYEQQLIEETQIRSDLSRYLNQDLVDAVVDRKTELKLGGERKIITVMFADVVAFTPLTEQHEPERVVAILNELFTFMTEIIFKHGGIIDKFIGDCVMAVFGAPTSRDDDALRAARAAEEMMRWLEVGNARWKKELGFELQMGIGINTGEAVVGNIGSNKRMEYTVIGDTVNVAARLEALARPGQILLTEVMAEAIEDEFDTASLGEHQLVGKQEPIEIFALVE